MSRKRRIFWIFLPISVIIQKRLMNRFEKGGRHA